jgi:hypothetical protein
MRHTTPRALLLIVLFLAATAGCDKPPPVEPDVPADEAISGLFIKINKLAGKPQAMTLFKWYFVPGCEPAENARQAYAGYRYDAKPPEVSGDTATIAVTVKDAKTQAVVGEVKWTAKKVENAWRLTDAPLPAK